MSKFEARFSREAWNDVHVLELQECEYVEFDGLHLKKNPHIGPDIEDLKWLRETLCRLEIENVLDLGCNIGLFRGLFDGWNYVGLDQSANAIAIAKKKFADSQFRCMDAQDLDNEEFDLVFTRAVMQHNLGQDKFELVKAINRSLRPGGYYLCCDGVLADDGLPDTFDIFDDDNARKFFEPLGFELLERKGTHCYLFKKN